MGDPVPPPSLSSSALTHGRELHHHPAPLGDGVVWRDPSPEKYHTSFRHTLPFPDRGWELMTFWRAITDSHGMALLGSAVQGSSLCTGRHGRWSLGFYIPHVAWLNWTSGPSLIHRSQNLAMGNKSVLFSFFINHCIWSLREVILNFFSGSWTPWRTD